jgi:hypothetical protein
MDVAAQTQTLPSRAIIASLVWTKMCALGMVLLAREM